MEERCVRCGRYPWWFVAQNGPVVRWYLRCGCMEKAPGSRSKALARDAWRVYQIALQLEGSDAAP